MAKKLLVVRKQKPGPGMLGAFAAIWIAHGTNGRSQKYVLRGAVMKPKGLKFEAEGRERVRSSRGSGERCKN